MYKIDKLISMYRHIHLHTHVSMSSTYVSLSQMLPVDPPNTTPLWWSILVKVWLTSAGGLSPVILLTAHTPAGTVTEQKCVSLSGPLDHAEGSISTIPYMAVYISIQPFLPPYLPSLLPPPFPKYLPLHPHLLCFFFTRTTNMLTFIRTSK